MQCAERGGERGEQETQRKGGRGKETDRERQGWERVYIM